LLRAIAEKKVRLDIKLEDLIISLISIFELQAKAAKLGVSEKYVIEAVETLMTSISRAFL